MTPSKISATQTPAVFVAPAQPEKTVQDKAKEHLLEWLRTSLGREIKPDEIEFYYSCLDAKVKGNYSFLYAGGLFKVYTRDNGSSFQIFEKDNLERAKKEAESEAIRYFFASMSAEEMQNRFRLEVKGKLIDGDAKAGLYGLGFKVDCILLGKNQHRVHTIVTDLLGQRLGVDKSALVNLPIKEKVPLSQRIKRFFSCCDLS